MGHRKGRRKEQMSTDAVSSESRSVDASYAHSHAQQTAASSHDEPANVSAPVHAVAHQGVDKQCSILSTRMSQAELSDGAPLSRTGSRFDILTSGHASGSSGGKGAGERCSRSALRHACRAHERAIAGVPVSEKNKMTRTTSSSSSPWAAAAAASKSHSRADVKAGLASADVTKSLNALGKPCDIPAQYTKRAQLAHQPFAYVLVCDFEATCDENDKRFPHEIIEFPVVALDTATLRVVDKFHAYVRPLLRPKLTSYCTQLTGITQKMVDSADTLPEVLRRFHLWLYDRIMPLCRHRRLQEVEEEKQRKAKGEQARSSAGIASTTQTALSASSFSAAHSCVRSRPRLAKQDRFPVNDQTELGRNYAEEERLICFATDGPWDMRRFMFECSVQRDGVDFPPLFYRFINVRQCYSECMRQREVSLAIMLQRLRMSFQGRQHSGIDDAMNITRIFATLLARGLRVRYFTTLAYNAHMKRNDDSTGGDAIAACRCTAQEPRCSAGGKDADRYSESRTIISELLTEEARSGSGRSAKGRQNQSRNI